MGQAAQPRRLLRGGGPACPAPGPGAGLGRGGGGDGVADEGFPLRPGELGGGVADLGGQLGIGAAGGPAAGCRPWPGAGQVEQPGGEPGGLPGALPAGGAAGAAEPGPGDRAGQDLQDGVLAVAQAGRGAGQRPQRRLRVMAGRQREDLGAGQPQRARRRPARRAGSGGAAGAVTVCAPGQAASTARSIRPGGMVPGTHSRIVIPAASPPAQAYSQPRCGCPCQQPGPGRAQQPGQVPPQRHRPVRAGLRRGQDRDQPGAVGEGGVLAAAQPAPGPRRRRPRRRRAAARPPGRNAARAASSSWARWPV